MVNVKGESIVKGGKCTTEKISLRPCTVTLSLYGIKQGSYLWNKHMHKKLSSKGFNRLPSDPVVYICCAATDTATTVIHVNNVLTIANPKQMLEDTC